MQPFGQKYTWAKNWGLCPLLGGGGADPSNNVACVEAYLHTRKLGVLHPFREAELGPHLIQCRLGQSLPTKWHLDPSSHFGHNRYGPKIGGVPPWGRGAGSLSDTMWPGTRLPACRFILIHPTVWPQYTDVTDGTGQWCDSIGQTVLFVCSKHV